MCSITGTGERLHKVLGQINIGTLESGERSSPFGLLVWYAGMGVSEKRCLVILVPEVPNYVPHRRGGGHIVFWRWFDTSCFHNISWTGWWILTEFAWM